MTNTPSYREFSVAPDPDSQVADGVAISAIGLAPLIPLLAAAVVGGWMLGAHFHRLRVPLPRRNAADAPPEPTLEPDCDYAPGTSEDPAFSDTLFCPICRAEYITGTLQCEDCCVDLVDECDLPPPDPPIEQGTIRILRVKNSMEAQLVRDFLAGYRIPCSMLRSSAWELLGADVYVFESDALRAKRLIRQNLGEMATGLRP